MLAKDLFKNYIYPISILSGSIIGVGFLLLPYITLKVGIWLMLFYFVLVTALIVLIHLIMAEISLKTPDYKRFPGFVKFYLGSFAERVSIILMVLGTLGILLAYLIIGSEFLTTIFSPIFGGGFLAYLIIYFLILISVVYFGVKLVAKAEFWAIVLLLFAFLFIFIKGFGQIQLSNIFLPAEDLSNWKSLFLPYGALMFALWGTGLIPEVEEMLRKKKKIFKKVIVLGTLLPAVIYLLFTVLSLSITGSQTTESALIGIRNVLGDAISITLFIGVITTFASFVTQALLLQEIFMYDLKLEKFTAWVFTCFPPLIIYFLGFTSFMDLIGLVGGLFLGINGIMILMMYKKIGGKNYIIYPLSLVFIFGIIYELIYFL